MYVRVRVVKEHPIVAIKIRLPLTSGGSWFAQENSLHMRSKLFHIYECR